MLMKRRIWRGILGEEKCFRVYIHEKVDCPYPHTWKKKNYIKWLHL